MHVGENLAVSGLLRVGQRRIGEEIGLADDLGRHLRQALPAVPCPESGRRAPQAGTHLPTRHCSSPVSTGG